MVETIVYGGPRNAPYPSDELTMMQFFSEKGVRGRAGFASEAVYFDDELW